MGYVATSRGVDVHVCIGAEPEEHNAGTIVILYLSSQYILPGCIRSHSQSWLVSPRQII